MSLQNWHKVQVLCKTCKSYLACWGFFNLKEFQLLITSKRYCVCSIGCVTKIPSPSQVLLKPGRHWSSPLEKAVLLDWNSCFVCWVSFPFFFFFPLTLLVLKSLNGWLRAAARVWISSTHISSGAKKDKLVLIIDTPFLFQKNGRSRTGSKKLLKTPPFVASWVLDFGALANNASC